MSAIRDQIKESGVLSNYAHITFLKQQLIVKQNEIYRIQYRYVAASRNQGVNDAAIMIINGLQERAGDIYIMYSVILVSFRINVKILN